MSRLSTCRPRPPSRNLCKWQNGFSERGTKRWPSRPKSWTVQGFGLRLSGMENTVPRAQGGAQHQGVLLTWVLPPALTWPGCLRENCPCLETGVTPLSGGLGRPLTPGGRRWHPLFMPCCSIQDGDVGPCLLPPSRPSSLPAAWLVPLHRQSVWLPDKPQPSPTEDSKTEMHYRHSRCPGPRAQLWSCRWRTPSVPPLGTVPAHGSKGPSFVLQSHVDPVSCTWLLLFNTLFLNPALPPSLFFPSWGENHHLRP